MIGLTNTKPGCKSPFRGLKAGFELQPVNGKRPMTVRLKIYHWGRVSWSTSVTLVGGAATKFRTCGAQWYTRLSKPPQ
jgi:hypothetical protein